MEDKGARSILAKNLIKLIDDGTPKGARRSIRAWAIGRKLDVRLITRLTKAENAITLDTLDEIARACGVQAWHLLLEDFQPGQHVEAPITEDERAMLTKLRNLLDR